MSKKKSTNISKKANKKNIKNTKPAEIEANNLPEPQTVNNSSYLGFKTFSFYLLISLIFVFMLNIAIGMIILPKSIHYYPYDIRRIFEIVILFTIILSIGFSTKLRHQCVMQLAKMKKSTKIAIAAFFSIGLTSSAYVQVGVNYIAHQNLAFLEVGLFSALFIGALVISQIAKEHKEKFNHWVMATLYIMIFIYLFLVAVQIIQYFILQEASTAGNINIRNSYFWQKAIAPTFSNIRFLSQYMSWTWPLLALPLIQKNKLSKSIKIGAAAIICLWFYQMLMLQGRALYLEYAIVPFLILILFRRNSIPWLKWQLIGLIIGGALWYIMYVHLLSGNVRTHSDLAVTSHTERWYIYRACLFAAAQHPMLGMGPMQLSDTVLPLNGYGAFIATPHNVLCKIIAEWGVPAFLIFCTLSAIALIKWLLHCSRVSSIVSKARKNINNINSSNNNSEYIKNYNKLALHICLSASIFAGLIHSMLSGVTTMPLSQTTMILVFGWAWGVYELYNTKNSRNNITLTQYTIKIYHVILLAILAITTFLICQGIFPHIIYIPWTYDIYNFYNGNGQTAPRFWGQGSLYFFQIYKYY